MCLLTPNGSLCACPDGSAFSKDGKRCLAGKNFLFLPGDILMMVIAIRLLVADPDLNVQIKNFTKPKLKPKMTTSRRSF